MEPRTTTEIETLNTLFPLAREGTAPTYRTALMRVSCTGCGATASAATRVRDIGIPALPYGWAACWTTDDGELAVWCPECQTSGRMERNER